MSVSREPMSARAERLGENKEQKVAVRHCFGVWECWRWLGGKKRFGFSLIDG